MKFRTRLLILLLTLTLLPLGLSSVFQQLSVRYFGNRLAEETRSLLHDNAVNLLHSQVDNYSRILRRDTAIALLTLQNQAEVIEHRLNSSPAEGMSAPVFYNEDFNLPQRRPKDLILTSRRLRPDQNGQLHPIPVSFSQQVIYLPSGVDKNRVQSDIRRISGMSRIYKSLHDIQPELFLWQYTALASGVYSSYPGKGGYPADYDPRRRPWYQDALAAGRPIKRLITDMSTRLPIMTIARPFHAGDGTVAGVTAVDIDYRQMFRDWSLPAEWAGEARQMILIHHSESSASQDRLEILLNNGSPTAIADWRAPIEPEFISLPEEQQEDILRDFAQGNSAVRQVRFQGEEVFWAYGSRTEKEPFPLVIVPLRKILESADTAGKYVNQQISTGLRLSAVLSLVALIAVILLSVIRARKVTDPVKQLASAAAQLANGDFAARVDIRTADEFQHLGQIFNDMGPRLKEREAMMRSLALAKEIQQQLLPRAVPTLAAFELSGKSLYCDETGGDYYDFIPLGDSERQLLGLALGDVSGHGVGSALVMAATRGALHALAEHHHDNLSRLCAELNHHLCKSTADADFMTFFFGLLDSKARTLTWISAGHAPIFLYRHHQIEDLQSSGIPLGIIDGIDYGKAATIEFSPGDFILVGTDGIWEMENSAKEMFGTERLRHFISSNAHLSAGKFTECLFHELDQFRGSHPQQDDITLMILKAV